MSDRRPVTGPNGSNPISDEQIRGLREQALNRKPHADFHLWTTCDDALEHIPPRAASWARRLKKRSDARTRCAAAYNARHTAKVTAETIMGWQIDESGASAEDRRAAQGQEPTTHEARYRWQRARERCAEAWNARQVGERVCDALWTTVSTPEDGTPRQGGGG